MEYLIKVSAILLLFYLCYKLFLNKETFFESNRTFLIVGILSAFALPFVVIPEYVIQESQIINSAFLFEGTITESASTSETSKLSLTNILIYTYLIGIAIFTMRFLAQFGSLLALYFNSTKKRVSSYIYVITRNALSPFSFFNWIVFNPNHFNDRELEQIITHEKVHAKQLHSVDIVLIELVSIILWFNPIIWLYKKDLRQNLEFIADKNANENTDCQKSYQHLLLKTSVPNYQVALTNNFYNSLIKKRIVMLHKNRSNKRNQLKFLIIIPVLTLFLMSFNTKKIYLEPEANNTAEIEISTIPEDDVLNLNTSSEERTIKKTEKKETPSKIKTDNSKAPVEQDIVGYFIESTFTDADLDALKDKLKAKGVTLKIKGVKRNSDNEITAIKIEAKSENSNANFSISNDDNAIKAIKIVYNSKDNSISIGNGKHLSHDQDYQYLHKDGVVRIDKSAKGSNVFVYSSDDTHDGEHEIIEDDDKIIIKNKHKVHEIKKHGKDKSVFIISDGDEVIDLKKDNSKGSFIIKKDKDGNILKEWKSKDQDGNIFIHKDSDQDSDVLFLNKEGNEKVIIKSGGASLWTEKDGEEHTVTTLGKGKNKIFISGTGEDPLYIIDGKEVKKKKMDIDPNNIESVNVLKGKAAEEKYGKKGKNGVIVITTKKKKE